MGKWTALAAVAVIVVVGVGVAYMSGAVGGHDVKGTFELASSGSTSSAGGCKGDGGYSDIHEEVEVTVKDETGKLLATSNLGPGTATGYINCHFEFSIKVPDAVKFCTFEVGRRGDLSFSHDEMVANGWTVGFSLGN